MGAPPSLAAGRQDAGVPWQLRNSYTKQIHEELTAYCVPKIVDTINYLGGVTEEGKLLPRKIDLNGADSAYQLGLFDALGK